MPTSHSDTYTVNNSQHNAGNATSSGLANLRMRALTALIGIPFIILALWIGFWPIFFITLLVASFAGLELRRLLKLTDATIGTRLAFVFAPALLVMLSGIIAALTYEEVYDTTNTPAIAVSVLSGTAIVSAIHGFIISRNNQKQSQSHRAVSLFGIYIAMSIAILPWILILDNGNKWLALAIFTVFASDTGAYFVGKVIGSHKMAPSISPGKTWEGFFGGIIAAIAASWGMSSLLQLDIEPTWALALGAAISIVGVAGDLIESSIKRLVGVKDTGAIIMGHGGMLDRIDSHAPNFILIFSFVWLTT